MTDAAALMRRWDEAMSRKDAATAAGLSPEDVEYLDHRGLGWEPLHGRTAVQAWYQSMFDAVGDLKVRSEVLESHGDTILLRQTGSFRARPQDGGGEAVLDAITLVTLRDGSFARIEIFEDEAAARGARAAS